MAKYTISVPQRPMSTTSTPALRSPSTATSAKWGLVSRTSYPTATRRGRRKAAKARATLSTISSFSSSGIRPRMS